MDPEAFSFTEFFEFGVQKMNGPDYSEIFAAWMTFAEFSDFLGISQSACRAKLADQTFIREDRLIDTRQSLANYIGRLRTKESKIGTAKGIT
ncbi:hypothetical protein M3484_18855 [Pseudomonas sp. GX19020]|uniref:hypothetical protein n=1 Tax=Pseudomonas sp. GX19020 TaxID=2942277 RepID=UPI00201927C8|nr:hypothetical protein [Pseudomonas sp. GX19020]MCL4068629.1 hypothetical protein [Pseudomonas sp. GX19020]